MSKKWMAARLLLGLAIDATPGTVILVGHSMAGVVITQAAEPRADKLGKLIYLAAYVPKGKQTLHKLGATDAASHVGLVIKIDPSGGVAGIPKDQRQDVFCAAATLDTSHAPFLSRPELVVQTLAGFVGGAT